MTTSTVRTRTRWDTLRHLLFGAWMIITIAGVVTTSRTSTYAALQADLAGGIDHVTVAGPPAPSAGRSLQEVRWRSDGVNHKVLVNVLAPVGSSKSTGNDLTTVDGPDAGAALAAQYPGLRISRTSLDQSRARAEATGGVQLGFRLDTPFDGPAGIAAGINALLAIIVIVFGPQPWRATRWAWFWLLGVPWIGLPAMLLLAGPTRWIPPPRSDRRLTGGKAFLLGALAYSGASVLHLNP